MCGFVAPPSKFQDPDVDMHKNLDLRGDGQGLGGGDVPGLNTDINDADGDGLDDNTGEPVGQDVQPALTCPNCGYEVEAAEPETVSTEDPTMGDASEVAEGASAGDLCPNCGEAPLMSPEEMAEAGLGDDPAIDPEHGEGDLDEQQVDEDGNPIESEEGPDADPRELGDPEDPDDEEREMPFDVDEGDDEQNPDDDHSEDDDSDDDDDKPAKRPFPPGKK